MALLRATLGLDATPELPCINGAQTPPLDALAWPRWNALRQCVTHCTSIAHTAAAGCAPSSISATDVPSHALETELAELLSDDIALYRTMEAIFRQRVAALL